MPDDKEEEDRVVRLALCGPVITLDDYTNLQHKDSTTISDIIKVPHPLHSQLTFGRAQL